MKKKLKVMAVLLTIVLSFFGNATYSYAESNGYYWPQGPTVTAPSAIVMDVTTGTILFEKNIHERHYPASITKILTTLIALERCDLKETVTFSQDAIYKTEGTSIWRDIGEKMSLEDTLYAVMLGSANECAYATAEHVTGDYSEFIKLMNEKAASLGCVDSHFNNPHGLPDEDHYTSAYDMALIARAAMLNEKFRTITGTSKYTIPETNKHDEKTYLVNHHAMLNYYHTGKYIYEYCVGGKTGYTQAARHTLVTYAYKDGMLLLSVVLNVDTTENQYKDTKTLLNYCFDNYQMLSVNDHEDEYKTDDILESANLSDKEAYLEIDKDAMVILPKTASFKDLVSKVVTLDGTDNIIGRIDYYYGDRFVGSANVKYTEVEVEEYKFRDYEKEKERDDAIIMVLNIKVIIIVIVAILSLAGIIYLLLYLKKNMYIIRYEMEAKKQRKEKASRFRNLTASGKIKEDRKFKR